MVKTRYALSGRVALVTGGSRGIGRAIALGLACSGVDVAVNYHTSRDAAAGVVAEIDRIGTRGLAVQADVADHKAVQQMLSHIESSLGPVEILVNNAGILKRTPVLDISLTEWDSILHTNLRGYFIVAQAVAREMVARHIRGCIVNISSRNALRASPQRTHYSVSKAGVTMLTKQMALDLAEHLIRVNEVNPGLIDTDLTKAELEDAAWRDHRIGSIPLRRIGTTEDVVGAVLFLASEDAGFITGTSVCVDGGAHIW